MFIPPRKGECAIFILRANKNKLQVLARESVTSGSVNVYTARFEFSDDDWQGLTRKAVFKAGEESRTVLLDENGECVIPWEVLTSYGHPLMAGVFGSADDTALPTTWASLGTVLEGVPGDGEGARPPTPDLWEQELGRKGDKLNYTESGELGLYAGEKLLSAVPVVGGGGEGGTSDHRLLSHRDAKNQHPIAAIDGLTDELARIPDPVEALTNTELEAILK